MCLLGALIADLALMLTTRGTAQTFTVLHSFTITDTNSANSDGAYPYARLILFSNTLYGTTSGGGSSGRGAVFALNTDGTGFRTIHSFTGGNDGAGPDGELVLSSNALFGTTSTSGYSDILGTVFAVNTDGTGFTNLYAFQGIDGAQPSAGLILAGNTLFGTTMWGGSSGDGTVFAVNTDGAGFTNLYNFIGTSGVAPRSTLCLSGKMLYGTTYFIADSNHGTVFRVDATSPSNDAYSTLHAFTGGYDGASPEAGMVLSGNTLYGTASGAGAWGKGTVFAVHTDGTGFTNIYHFTGGINGAFPFGGLVLSGDTLYGTTMGLDSADYGTVFSVKTDGTGFTTLYTFSGGSDGHHPMAGVILSGRTLYGTTSGGGASDNGTVFSVSLGPVSLPQLAIIPAGTNVVLSWPGSAAGFALQSTTNIAPSAGWNPVFPTPVIVNGQFTVTNPISLTPQFFRLSQ